MRCILSVWFKESFHNSFVACCFTALKLLSEPTNLPAMINCAIGKDRTGVVSALVLGCLGKSKEYIATDYARSEVRFERERGGV